MPHRTNRVEERERGVEKLPDRCATSGKRRKPNRGRIERRRNGFSQGLIRKSRKLQGLFCKA
jgi:hypothetical protein